MIGNLLR